MRGLRKRKVRFPMIVEDNVRIRRIEELREHPDTNAIFSYYDNGKLITWLRDRYYDDIADSIEELDSNSKDFASSLLSCLGIETTETNIDFSEIAINNKKLERVRRITDNKNLINEYTKFAFDDAELERLMQKNTIDKIYLYGNIFKLPSRIRKVYINGINNPCLDIGGYSFEELRSIGLNCSNILITSEKLERVRSITNDSFIESNFDKVAFNDEDFDKLMNTPNIKHIWLYGECFKLMALNKKVEITGITPLKLDIGEYSFNDLKRYCFEYSPNITITSKKLKRVRSITNDKRIIDNFDEVAFDDDEFEKLLKTPNIKQIWLYGKRFNLNVLKRDVEIFGLNDGDKKPVIDLGGYNFNSLSQYNVKIENAIKTSDTFERVKAITNDKEIMSNFELVAFDDNELMKLINNEKIPKIYLFGEHFSLPLVKRKISIRGINKPIIELKNGKSYDEYYRNGIDLINVSFKDPKVAFLNGFSNLSVGSSFKFGNYNNAPIEWTVISKTTGFTMLIATNLKLSMPLNSIQNEYRWSDCTLRKWLNNDFYNAAFNSVERLHIYETKLYTTQPGLTNPSFDKVFIFSKSEYDNLDRKFKLYFYGSWLRSSTYGFRNANVVDFGGSPNDYDTFKRYGVVPVIMLKDII